MQELREELELFAVYADLAHLRLEYEALNADDIADIDLAEGLEGLLADVVEANVDLDPALAVHKVGKDGLAHSALCHNSSGDGGLLIFESIEIVLYILRICRSREFCDMEGVFTLVAEGGKLISSNL